MKRFLIISATLHVVLFLVFTFGNLSFFFPQPTPKQQNTIRVEFLEKLPERKDIIRPSISKPKETPKPKDDQKETTPPPKPAPGIKTKVTAPEPTKKEPVKEEPKKVTAPKVKEKPKKDKVILKKDKKTPPKKEKEKKLEETSKKAVTTDPKQQQNEKPSAGIEKKKQEVESVDALLNTLLPDVGGKRDESDNELQEEDAADMPEKLEDEAIHEIRSQIEAVWSYNQTEGIDFYLKLKIDRTGRILEVSPPSGIENQNALQKAAADAAYRAAIRLGQFLLKPHIFKPEFYEGGWDELEIHFNPSS
jgi:outer membrane biosynthesis protein TonB